jgi:hypothetical protein
LEWSFIGFPLQLETLEILVVTGMTNFRGPCSCNRGLLSDNNLEYQDSYFGLTCMFVEHFALLVEANRIFDKSYYWQGCITHKIYVDIEDNVTEACNI